MKALEPKNNDSEETMRLIMNSALDAIVCIDRSGEITVWTPQAEKIFGWKEEEMKGKLLTETIIPESYRERHIRGFNKYLETGEGPVLNKLFEITALDSKGREFPIELTIAPVSQGENLFFCAFIRDITERKKVEKDLRTSELKYRSLIEQASDPIMITDNKGNFLELNTSFCRKFGYSKDELLGLNISMVIDPEQLKRDPIRFDLLTAGHGYSRERKMMHKDGTIIEVEANVKMIPDGRILAIARDITERKKANAIIEASEKKLRQVLSSTTNNFYVIDRNYEVILINDAAESNLEISWGIPVKVGTNISDVIMRRENQQLRKRFEKVFSGEKIEYELQLHVEGLPEWTLVSILPVIDDNNMITGAHVVGKDVSERKKITELVMRERDLSDSIINSLPGVFYIIDKEGKYLRWNRNMETVLGYSAEEIPAMTRNALADPEDHDKINEAIAKVFQEGFATVEANAITKTGVKIPFYLTGIPIIYQGGPCVIGTGVDISALKKAEENLKKSYEDVRMLTEHLQLIREQERTNIAREIHDELGQQLTVLKMDASWLNKKLSGAEKSVKEKLKDLLELLDITVKSVRRISSELRPSLLDDLGLIAAIEWHLKEFEKRSGITTAFQVDQNELFLNDEIKTGLFRIFQESLTNVARHAKATKVQVSLSQDNGAIILSIKDDGQGFDRPSVSAKKTLGILGMEERTAMMGGNYLISSEAGSGTIVTVSIPVQIEIKS